jgi:hypothetical protein
MPPTAIGLPSAPSTNTPRSELIGAALGLLAVVFCSSVAIELIGIE